MNNQPAFPIVQTNPEGLPTISPGMSLRDYFAAKAMQSRLTEMLGGAYIPNLGKCAKFAYEMADAMLVERERGGQA